MPMTCLGFLLAALMLVPASLVQQNETPPYDSAPPIDKITPYINADLAFTVSYPREFLAGTPVDLQTVIERHHRAVYGTDPTSDPNHLEAVRCVHTLLYAAADSPATDKKITRPPVDEETPDTILVTDVDRSCVPKDIKGDEALSDLVGTVLNVLPNSIQVVPQMWFVAGGNRRIHSGLAGSVVTFKRPAADASAAGPSREVPLFVMAAAVEQKGHRILIVYLRGTTAAEDHLSVPHMSIAFEDGRPVLLFPFLVGHMNLIR